MKTYILAALAAGALLLSACGPTAGAKPDLTVPLSVANDKVIKLNGKIQDAGQVLATYCPYLQLFAGLGASVTSQKHIQAVSQAQAALNVACSVPVYDVQSAAILAIAAYEAAKAAGVTKVAVAVQRSQGQ